METKFKSQICTTREQSERLLALGLKKETADMFYDYCKDRIGYTWYLVPKPATLGDKRSIPAWSLHRLIEMIDDECVIHLSNFSISGKVFTISNNLYDNICNCIEWLIKKGYFNKEYLKE